MENWMALLIAIIGSSWVGPTIREAINDKKKKKRPGERMILAMGRRQLLADAKQYMQKGGIPEDEYEVFAEEFEAYTAMHGNSKVKKWCEAALKLPIIYDEEDQK